MTRAGLDRALPEPREGDGPHYRGVLFDFSGTLFRIASVESCLRTVLDAAGLVLPEADVIRYTRELAEAGALPGGPSPSVVPPELTGLWEARDSTAEGHRAAFTALARRVPLPADGLYDALYALHMEPAAWRPYPDAAEVLDGLRRRGVPVAVVSNIGWDLRRIFREHGLDGFVDAYVLSYEHGVQKPDARLFRVACDALGLDPREALMVGDDRHADAGAAALGCGVHLVDHLPVDRRPDGLRPVLRMVDDGAGSGGGTGTDGAAEGGVRAS